jgi:uncharacterized protein (TIGR03437 family)
VPLLVAVNGLRAHLYFYCSAATSRVRGSDQVNVLTPLDSATGPVGIRLHNGMHSAAVTANLQAASPSFPLISGTRYVVATYADYTLVGPAALSSPGYPITPAAPNERIVLYGFGFGSPRNPLVAGSGCAIECITGVPVCQIGGVSATVLYAGVISPVLYQLNVVVPGKCAQRRRTGREHL